MSPRRRGVCAAQPFTSPDHGLAPVELVVVHPGGLSSRCWARMAAQLPARTPVTVLELEGVNAYWAAGRSGEPGGLTAGALAERLRAELERAPRAGRRRVLLGWGFGGVIAHALAGVLIEPPERVVALESVAPGAGSAPAQDELLQRFAMYLGARRGRALDVDAARLTEPVDTALGHLLAAAGPAAVLREDTSPAALRRLYDRYAHGERRDHRLTETYAPGAAPLTVVHAARSVLARRPDLGWAAHVDALEVLASGGDHYSMLTDPAAVAHLAMTLRRWFAPLRLAA